MNTRECAEQFIRDSYAPYNAPMFMLANRLGISQRSLSRALRASGTSWQELRDAECKRRVDEYLSRTGSKARACEIAPQLGYTEACNFVRAVKRWYGRTFSEVRAQV